ncbi:hypothetical protein D3C81_1437410 [compost metagenome]
MIRVPKLMRQRVDIGNRAAERHENTRLFALRQGSTESAGAFAGTVLRLDPAFVKRHRGELSQLGTKITELLNDIFCCLFIRYFTGCLPQWGIHVGPAQLIHAKQLGFAFQISDELRFIFDDHLPHRVQCSLRHPVDGQRFLQHIVPAAFLVQFQPKPCQTIQRIGTVILRLCPCFFPAGKHALPYIPVRIIQLIGRLAYR